MTDLLATSIPAISHIFVGSKGRSRGHGRCADSVPRSDHLSVLRRSYLTTPTGGDQTTLTEMLAVPETATEALEGPQ